jgi:hypothetical protein
MAKAKSTIYPIRPKSTALLLPGQFWAVPLTDGRFACGRVLQVNGSELPVKSRNFFGGLLNWVGASLPSSECIAGAVVIASGVLHIRAITSLGGEVLGCRPIEADGLELPILLSARGGDGTLILCGADAVRVATREEWGTLPVLGCWGWNYIQKLAIARFKQPGE